MTFLIMFLEDTLLRVTFWREDVIESGIYIWPSGISIKPQRGARILTISMEIDINNRVWESSFQGFYTKNSLENLSFFFFSFYWLIKNLNENKIYIRTLFNLKRLTIFIDQGIDNPNKKKENAKIPSQLVKHTKCIRTWKAQTKALS